MALRCSAISAMPTSGPCFTWLPRVEVVQAAGDVLQPGQVVGHGLPGEGAQALVGGAGVQGVGGVGQNGEEPLLLGESPVGGHVLQIQGLGLAAPGIAGEELEGVGPNLYGFLSPWPSSPWRWKDGILFSACSFSFRGWQGSPAPFHCTEKPAGVNCVSNSYRRKKGRRFPRQPLLSC